MEATPDSLPETPPDSPAPETGRRPRTSLGNVLLLLGLVLGLFVTGIVLFTQLRAFLALARLAAVVLIPILVPLALGRWGRKRGWPATVVRRGSIAFIALWLIGLAGVIGKGIYKARDSSNLKAMIPGQLSAATDRFFLEFGDRIFLSYGEVVGPQAYISHYNPVDGEDLSTQFPIRRGWSEELPVRLPDGSTVQRYEVFAAVGRSGLIATYPRQQGQGYDPERVYRLESGVSYRGGYVVNLPPDPAGREGRDQNGVHTIQLPDGRRFEITYHGGVPDGPFRAFYADGRPWGEATYRQGRVTEASVISRKGHRFDELHDGPAAAKALDAEAMGEAAQHAWNGREKLAAKDFRGAMADFTIAINCYQYHSSLYLDRATARLALGDREGAIKDCTDAATYAQNGDERVLAWQRLEAVQQRK